jgi:hypothetical protein
LRTRHGWAWRLGLAGAVVEAVLVASTGTLAATSEPTLTAPQGVSISVDGKIGQTEWVDAAQLPLPFKDHPGTLYVKHDSDFLYVLLVVQDHRLPKPCCDATVYFHRSNEQDLRPPEDAMKLLGRGLDEFWDGNVWSEDEKDPSGKLGEEDVTAAESYDAATKRVVLEGAKPFCSKDRAHDLCLQVGMTLSFTVDYLSATQEYREYPALPWDAPPYGRLELSPEKKPPPQPPKPGQPTAAPASGLVTVRTTANGTKVDATKGTATVRSKAPNSTKAQTAKASLGQFVVTQKKGKALTVLRLSKPFKCGRGYGTTRLRRLVVVADGKFRTQGARGWAMPKGRKGSWQTTDFCVPRKRHLAGETKGRKGGPRRVGSCYRNKGTTPISVHDQEFRPPDFIVRPRRRHCVYH